MAAFVLDRNWLQVAVLQNGIEAGTGLDKLVGCDASVVVQIGAHVAMPYNQGSGVALVQFLEQLLQCLFLLRCSGVGGVERFLVALGGTAQSTNIAHSNAVEVVVLAVSAGQFLGPALFYGSV